MDPVTPSMMISDNSGDNNEEDSRDVGYPPTGNVYHNSHDNVRPPNKKYTRKRTTLNCAIDLTRGERCKKIKKENTTNDSDSEGQSSIGAEELDNLLAFTSMYQNFDMLNVDKIEDEELFSRFVDRTLVSQANKECGDNKDFMEYRKSLIPKKISFEDVAGYKDVLDEISRLVVHFRYPDMFDKKNNLTQTGFLLYGPPGCGKTFIATALAGDLKMPLIKVTGPELISKVPGESEKRIRSIFRKAIKYSPAILLIDEIDVISKNGGSSGNSMEGCAVTQLLCCMDELNIREKNIPVMIIGATNQIHKLDPALRRAGRLDMEIGIGMPDCETRFRILQYLSEKHKLLISLDICLRELAGLTAGYVATDIKSLLLKAFTSAVQRCVGECTKKETTSSDILIPIIGKSDFLACLESVQPSSKKEGFVTVPDVTWDDIGALADARKELRMAILNPIKHPEMYNELGLPISGSVLLYGPPGCGKTLLAKATANEAGINFIAVTGPELLRKYLGDSEMAVRSCFQRARTSQPCVIFFDEIDAICARRDRSDEYTNRIINLFLTEMDGIRNTTGVFLIGATKFYDMLDPAILRHGRFDNLIYVGLPGPVDRFRILQALTKHGTKPRLAVDVDLEKIAYDERCNSCTGADLSKIVNYAGALAIEERVSQCPDIDYEKQCPLVISRKHFEIALGRFGRTTFSNIAESCAGEDL